MTAIERASLVALLLSSLAAAPAAAGNADHERARRAVESGEVLPLAAILETVERDFEGEVIEIELERDDDRWVYEIDLVTRTGHVIELTYDARSRTLLEADGEGVAGARRRP